MVTKESLVDIAAQYENKGMKDLKDDVAEALIVYLTPLQAEIQGWLKNEDALTKVLADGSQRAAMLAETKIKNVKNAMGLLL
ncbi:MAG: Tryptophanyl-tRNA ligase [Candidatus Uhrbacteria bacterium GW2011_GWD2_52_7]|uniref:Tryptophanyl-tRNA ligase n=1 Tax=Candidatus Uhrbacteria bacterium GW2011_GWD2_52_7 TaxID=1618989 RepID=A0A0G1ZRM7_9BACT|nr:MAG: Tryptophanyl-tRNA ligase [Candidatus Uhrbacteria bacterium GW2011_GWD2_52_7]